MNDTQQALNQPPQYQEQVVQGQQAQQGYVQNQQYAAPNQLNQPPQLNNQQQINQGNYPTHAHGIMQSTVIRCSQCQECLPTRVTVNTATVPSIVWCLFGSCFCCFIPGCCPNTSEYKHFCAKCGFPAGQKDAECI